MKKLIFAGLTALVAGVAAFALVQDGRDNDTQAPVEQARETQEAAPADLVAPEPIVEEVAEAEGDLPEGWWVCEDGHVWEPLSFDKPQVRNNGDGTITMRKLGRIWEDGQMREVPIKARAIPRQDRLPVKKRSYPEGHPSYKPTVEYSQDGE